MRNSLDLLLDEVSRLIAIADYESALIGIKKWLDILAVDYRLHGRVFSSSELDQICLEIGKKVLKSQTNFAKTKSASSPIYTVFVTSELHLAGGHTKVLEDYVRALNGKKIIVLVTDPTNSVDRNAISAQLAALNIELRFSPKFLSLIDKLKWLIDTLASIESEQCYLLNHANDPIAVAAMQPDLVPNLTFVHHCDHTFTLGIHLPQSKHIDFRTEGFNNCRNSLGINNNTLINLVAQDLNCPSAIGRFLANGKLHTCTSGGYKFEIPYAFQLASELPDWLKVTEGMHTHIGNLSAASLKELRMGLNKLDIPQDRLQIIPFTKSLWTELINQKIDLYIDSFPVSGARSIVEAMGAGIPTVIHHNYASVMWSNINSVYPQAYTWRRPHELSKYLASITKDDLEKQSQFAREYYLKNHHPDQLLNNLLAIEQLPSLAKTNADNSFYDTNSLKTFMDQFAPIPFQSQRQKEVISQFLALLRASDVLNSDMITHLKNYLAPSDYYHFKELMAEIKTTSLAIDSIDHVYPILTEKGHLDKEKLTNLLYETVTANGSRKHASKQLKASIKAKILFYRLKEKYDNLFGQNN